MRGIDPSSRKKYVSKEIAKEIIRCRRNNKLAYPSRDIETLREMAIKVVAQNIHMYPDLKGIEDQNVQEAIVKLMDTTLETTITARNVDFEEYWKKKCDRELRNCRKEDHGCSYKQAYIERFIQKTLEDHKDDASIPELKKELDAARFEVFCLKIT